jgi:hypothetical protein
VTEVDLIRAPDHTPQARPGARRKVSDCLFQEPARPWPAALKLAAWIGRRTVNAASPRQLFPPVQLTRHSTGRQRPVLYGGDRGNHTRTHPGHIMNCAFMRPANRLLTPDHARGSTSHGPFGQTSPLDYHRHVPDCRQSLAASPAATPSQPAAAVITGCGCSTNGASPQPVQACLAGVAVCRGEAPLEPFVAPAGARR